MAQIFFGGTTTPNAGDLDGNFTDLYNRLQPVSSSTAKAIGLGSAPSAWGLMNAIEGAVGAVSWNPGGAAYFVHNLWFDGANWNLKATGPASMTLQISGGHQFFTAPSGTAGAVATLTQRLAIDVSGNGTAGVDNAQTWGSASKRWSVIYAGTGTINTSDAREKTTVSPLTTNEIAAAKALAAEIGTYQWLAAMQTKGADARTHVGLTVQRVIEILTANSLDPMKYGFVCYDSWPEMQDSEGNVIEVAGDRYSLRPDELLLFLARGFDARLQALEGAH